MPLRENGITRIPNHADELGGWEDLEEQRQLTDDGVVVSADQTRALAPPRRAHDRKERGAQNDGHIVIGQEGGALARRPPIGLDQYFVVGGEERSHFPDQ